MWIFGVLLAFVCESLNENIEENMVLYVNYEFWEAKKLMGGKYM